MNKEEINKLFEEHLKVLANAAKKQCSGEDLKAITEAMMQIISFVFKGTIEVKNEKIMAELCQTLKIQPDEQE